jgi:hypothetical protein
MPRVPGCDAVYEVADQWRERCLIGDGSLLWPDLVEPTWTIEDIDRARICMADLVERRTMRDVNMIDRFSDEPDSTKRVIADATAIWNVCPGFPTPRNRKSVTAGVAEAASPNPNLELFNRAIDCEIGKSEQRKNSTMYQAGRGWDLHFLLTFCLQLKSNQSDPNNFIETRAVGSKLASSLKDGSGVLNMVLHMLFPSFVEPIFSVRDKKEIPESADFAYMAAGISDPDEIIAAIRSELVRQGQPVDFSFYDDAIHPRWVGPRPQSRRRSKDQLPEGDLTDGASTDLEESRASQSRISLALSTSLSDEVLADIETLTRVKKQIILEGPPGSGKTYVARLFARYLAGLPLDGEPDDHVEIVQFH